MALLSAFISHGTDVINKYLQQPDFEIGTQKDAVNAYLFPYSTVDELQVDREKSLLDEMFIEQIIGLLAIGTGAGNGCVKATDRLC